MVGSLGGGISVLPVFPDQAGAVLLLLWLGNLSCTSFRGGSVWATTVLRECDCGFTRVLRPELYSRQLKARQIKRQKDLKEIDVFTRTFSTAEGEWRVHYFREFYGGHAFALSLLG